MRKNVSKVDLPVIVDMSENYDLATLASFLCPDFGEFFQLLDLCTHILSAGKAVATQLQTAVVFFSSPWSQRGLP